VSVWPDPVERVAQVLRAGAVDGCVEEFESAAATAEAAAAAVGCQLAQIVKSIVLVCDGAAVLALVPGTERADLDAVAAAAPAREVRVAKPAEVIAATGFEPGGVAPFPHRSVSQVLMEQSLLALPRVWVGAGTEFHMAALAPHDLQRLSGARLVEIILPR
jgi:Cys-tRNA(Pro) deacylase